MLNRVVFTVILLGFVIMTKAATPDPVRGKNGMVVSASDLASQVGIMILKKGGNAVDAAVATGFALAVTYPAAGNLGGGGYMVIHLADGRNTAIDFREKAPARAHRDMYIDGSGRFDSIKSTLGITSSGVPGSVAGLIYALEKYGTMKLEEVIQPAVNLALDGFPLSYRLSESINANLESFLRFKSSTEVFTKNGIPYKEGDIFKQPDLAETLLRIKKKGVEGFYKGHTAELIVKQSDASGGYLTLDDLAAYSVIEKPVISGTYRGYDVISMPPSSSGGIALIEALNILENFSFSRDEWNSSRYINRLVETLKHVYADRTRHLGDENFYPVPKEFLISKGYAKNIFEKITDRAVPSTDIYAGTPPAKESEQTTHYSITDQYGNAVSTTTTINSSYGSKLVVEGAGFLLNNEMDDFSAKPGVPNQFGLIGSEANSIAPGKRMLSCMTPTIVLKNGKPFLVIGSPGGSTIITVVLQTILNVVDFGMDIQQAVSAPKIHHQWLPDEINYEDFGLSADVISNLTAMGYKMGPKKVLGRAEGIIIDNENGIIYGATDPRGYGMAAGY